MRNRYGYNCQVVNWGNFGELTPLGYIEVVPGETLQGAISLAVRSQPTTLAIDTRAYVDAFAFYIPHRLTWEGFPTFVAGGGGTPNYVSNLFPFNFETRFTTSDASGNYDRNMPWLRGGITQVWNKFFKREDQTDRLMTDVTVPFVSNRDGRLETRSLLGSATNFDTNVPLAGTSPNQTLSINQMRSAMATDRFGRMRQYYGSKYVDYLRALGVEVEWSLMDEPELLGQVHKDWRFRQTAQTAPAATAPQNTVGQMAGMFYSTFRLPIKRTFIPEHGTICVYGVLRCDALYSSPPVPPLLCKKFASQYWSPEYETVSGVSSTGAVAPGQGLSQAVFESPPAGPIAFAWKVQQFEELRSGLNYNRQPTNGPLYAFLAADGSSSNIGPTKYIAPANVNSQFTQPATQVSQFRCEYRIVRHSPVKRADLMANPPLK